MLLGLTSSPIPPFYHLRLARSSEVLTRQELFSPDLPVDHVALDVP